MLNEISPIKTLIGLGTPSLEEMATHSSVLAWRVPGTAEPGGLPSMGSHRVRHDLAAAAAAVLPLFLHDNVNLHTTTD